MLTTILKSFLDARNDGKNVVITQKKTRPRVSADDRVAYAPYVQETYYEASIDGKRSYSGMSEDDAKELQSLGFLIKRM